MAKRAKTSSGSKATTKTVHYLMKAGTPANEAMCGVISRGKDISPVRKKVTCQKCRATMSSFRKLSKRLHETPEHAGPRTVDQDE